MKSPLPICRHTDADFNKAMKLYHARFNVTPPGEGHTEARYLMLYAALNSDTIATEANLQRWHTALEMISPQSQWKEGTYDPKTRELTFRLMSMEETKRSCDNFLENFNPTTMQRWNIEHWLARQRLERGQRVQTIAKGRSHS